MIAKHFSRGDVCLITHLTHVSNQDPHFPFSEKAVISYFERATMTDSVKEKLQQHRSNLLSISDHKIIKMDTGEEIDALYTLRGMVHVANAMIKEYAIPASYLQNVVSRIAEEVNGDDKKYMNLKKQFIDCIAHDAGYKEDKKTTAIISAAVS